MADADPSSEAQDLRERIRALEEENTRIRESLDTVLEGLPVGVSIVSLDGNFLSWPRFNESFFGYTAEEVIGKMGPTHFLADPAMVQVLQRAMAVEGRFEDEVVLVRKDGTHVPTRSLIVRRFDRDGTHVGFVGLAVDISTQKEMERKLRIAEERSRALMDNLPDIFYQTDITGKISYVNESGARMLGYRSPAEILGKDLAEEFYVDPTERREFLERLQSEGGVLKDFVVRLWRADGSIIWMSAHSRFRRDDHGTVVGVEGLARDVTDRVDAERRFVEQMEELERAYDRLKQAQTQLIRSEKMASLGTLIAGIAHEINNPVNFVHGNLDFLQRQYAAMEGVVRERGLPGPGAEAMADIRDAIVDAKRGAARVKEIVETLRSFSRAGGSRRHERMRLQGSLEEALRLVEPAFRNRVDVTRRIHPDVEVEGDRGLLGQVWINLLLNAFQASGEGGRVTVESFRSGDEAVVRVHDTGPGIPDEHRERIFEPFFSTKEDGVGLGLSLSWDIVQGTGGELSVESDPGKGSCFEVRLPALPPSPESP